MELTPQEQRLLKPYLRMAAGEGRGWLMGVAVGLAVCAGAVAVVALGRWPEAAPYCPLAFVVGLVIIEQALDRRDRRRMASILQKYDTALQSLLYPEEAEETV
ncbi:MAG: hypothetical protein GXY85_06920 [Candidatus Brocadiaceae bacterium]|nr:hypothetical protein [Candidatus Brocadiaceae bacterium]